MNKIKKINTIPNGRIILGMLITFVFITVIIAIILIPKVEGYAMLLFPLIFCIAIWHYVHTKHNNIVHFSDIGIRHKNQEYRWEEVYITMNQSKPKFIRNSFDYYFYFGDKYLSEEDIKSRETKKRGFYLVANSKRAEYILSLYNKRVQINSEMTSYGKKIFDIVSAHNNKLS